MSYRTCVSVTGLLLAALVAATPDLPSQQHPASGVALSDAEISALVARAIADQHRNDAAILEYERTEKVTARGKDGANHEVIARVVPNGIANYRVELERDGKPTAAADLEAQWRSVKQSLAVYSDPDNPGVKLDRERSAKKNLVRDQLEDSVGRAFRFHWVGREVEGNRTLVEFTFDPDPAFHPVARYSNALQHVSGRAWLEESSAQLVRVDAELFEDAPLYGLIARLYRGGQFEFEQEQVGPGVWLPSRYAVNVDARKLWFGVNMHERATISGYRHIGPPKEALVAIESDHPGVAAVDPR
jgi:hypothetical protein